MSWGIRRPPGVYLLGSDKREGLASFQRNESVAVGGQRSRRNNRVKGKRSQGRLRLTHLRNLTFVHVRFRTKLHNGMPNSSYPASMKCWLMADLRSPSEFLAQHWIPQHFSRKHTIVNSLRILRSKSGDSRLKPGWDPDPLVNELGVLFQVCHVFLQPPLMPLFPFGPPSGLWNWTMVLSISSEIVQRLEVLSFDLNFVILPYPF